jgi:hypothetical protein
MCGRNIIGVVRIFAFRIRFPLLGRVRRRLREFQFPNELTDRFLIGAQVYA